MTPSGLHVALTAAAQRGKVYVCGASAPDQEAWAAAGAQLTSVAGSFRLRDGLSIY